MAASRQISSSNYRPEIQGVRTIGALLVACFHIWGARVSGGVDVFFVISGFLITGSLYKEVKRNQTIDVLAFWGRIAKRVTPTAYLVLCLTLLAALIWMPKSRQDGFLSEVFYSTFHLENVKLMMNSVDYLARGEAPSPVQQFWALSVQVQFYLVWPFVLLAVAVAARRARIGAPAYIATLSGILLTSLVYSILQTRADPSPTYFDTLARMWEFALGGIIAIALPYVTISPIMRFIAGWIGLLAIVSCGFIFPRSVHFPGYVALWPTIGAALVLLSGGGTLTFGADRLLGSKPLSALGDISFAFYLWHWPVLIFALLISDKTQLGLQAGLQVIAMSLCCAYVSSRWFERPIQQSKIGKDRTWHVHAMAAALAAPILLGAGLWTIHNDFSERFDAGSLADYPGGNVPASAETMMKPEVPLLPTPAAAKLDNARIYREKCHQGPRPAEIIQCDYGKVDGATRTIVLVGGSHSAHWFPALEALAQRYGWRLVTITKSACPFELNPDYTPACIEWNEHVIERLAELKPDAVFTTSTRSRRDGPDKDMAEGAREYVPEGYLAQWMRLADKGLSVIAIRDNPWMLMSIPDCLEIRVSDMTRCSVYRKLMMDDVDPAKRLERRPANVSFVDLTDRFCDRTKCYPISGNVLIYKDDNHITATFSRTLASTLGERMKQVRPDLFTVDAQRTTDMRPSVGAGG
ncbi:acyltransferase family protein [Microvirga sp. 2MCAF35]|uniref:acyltransferase family protein n=1 Tax=Microvirga sp. 2MCAF35 TaxID=3232987 RepID=UPI003F9CFD38